MTAWVVRAVRLPDGDDLDAGITAEGHWSTEPLRDAEPLPGRFALPGLVDAHRHLTVAAGEDGLPYAVDVTTARANLDAARRAGVTTVRDAGSPAGAVLALVPEVDGLLVCGRFLAPPDRYFPALLPEPVPAEHLVDAALAEVSAGARWVKLVADFPHLRDGAFVDNEPTYDLADVERLVATVHAAGARVAAHTTTRFVADLVAVGVDSIEHGTVLDDTDLTRLAAQGGAWTPTLCASFPRRAAQDPAFAEAMRHRLTTAVALGVTIMTGTDVVGTVAREVALLAELGVPPAAALTAASSDARRFLGAPQATPGGPVDLVTYHDDPRSDPAVLSRPAAVFARGVRLR
ncbi:amidohydrolase family protein [Dactylosporangium vinaceum]|uniref:Amidohydrolase family protein n=1 Tax=Dactylosporangium vinaceum TaxID=53362 RepID=A0ABV5M9M7_9ACTN|nr:amidohydrolase family protein [Dactylosporangium vinaceum]UAC00054.1 amidohydrolase family protein [Dactylosporangium vinaceum]